MSAGTIEFTPEFHKYFADFPRDLKDARATGELMALGVVGAVTRMGFAAKALAACARAGVDVSRVARVSGPGKPRVSAFYESYESRRG